MCGVILRQTVHLVERRPIDRTRTSAKHPFMRRIATVVVLVMGGMVPAALSQESPLDSAQLAQGQAVDARDAALSRGTVAERLRAIRAAPFLPEPELGLSVLVPLAAGRDATLAPAAAVAIRRITERLDRGSLDAHEVDAAELGRTQRALGAIARDSTARADIRRLAGLAAAELGAVLAP